MCQNSGIIVNSDYYFVHVYLAAVHEYVRLVHLRRELDLVLPLQLDGATVAACGRVVPRRGVEAGVGEVLVRLGAHQADEGELDRPQGVVADPKPAPEGGVPALVALPPRDVRHPAGVDVGEDAGLPARGHVAVHLHSVVGHTQVRINPVETWTKDTN